MVHYFKNRFDASGFFTKENPKIYNFITGVGDFLDDEKSLSLMDDTKFKEYALAHPEKNMIELYEAFNFPIPSNEQEKRDPRFRNDILYKKDSKGNLIPRENIYYCEKHIKGYKSPLKPASSYTILNDDEISIDQSLIKPKDKENNFDSIQKRKKLDDTIIVLQKSVRKSFASMKELNRNKENIKQLRYEYCKRYYMNQFGNKQLEKITLDEVNALGKVYYIIKTAQETDYLVNPFLNLDINPILYENNNNNTGNIFQQQFMVCKKKEIIKKVNINALLKNANVSENKFGFLSIEKGDSQKIINEIINAQLESQKNSGDSSCITMKSYTSNNNDSGIKYSQSKNNGNSLLINDYHILLTLKGKKMKGTNSKKNQSFYFSFFIENKPLINVEVAFSSKVSKINWEKFCNVMKSIKFGEDVIIVFGYNPTKYFDIESGNYHMPLYEKVFFIDSSKSNPKVSEIFYKIYN